MTNLAQKLQLKSPLRLAVLNCPEARFPSLAAELEGFELTAAAKNAAPAVLLFVLAKAELERHLVDVIQAVQPDSLLWIAYPKGGSGVQTDLNRDRLAEAVTSATGWRPVRQIAIDEVWSALRFRPAEKVGK